MNAETARNKIPDLVAGRLDEATAREIRALIRKDEALREYHDGVEHLYSGEFDLEVTAPETLRPFAQDDGALAPKGGRGAARRRTVAPRGGSRLWLQAAAMLVLVGGSVLVWRIATPDSAPDVGLGQDFASSDSAEPDASETESQDPPVPFEPLPFLPVDLEMPPLPVAYHTGEWLDSREEAVLTSIYTGRPMLESYTNPKCPMSAKVDETLCQTKSREMLKEFVCYREDFRGEVPESVRDEVDANEIVRRLPAIRLSRGDCEAEVLWQISDFADVEEDVMSYARRCEQRGGRRNVCLDRRAFERNVEILEAASEHTRGHRFADALSLLDSILRCNKSSATAFGEAAAGLRDQIVSRIDLEMERLDRLADSSKVTPEQLRDLAERLAKRVDGLDEYEKRVRAYTKP